MANSSTTTKRKRQPPIRFVPNQSTPPVKIRKAIGQESLPKPKQRVTLDLTKEPFNCYSNTLESHKCKLCAYESFLKLTIKHHIHAYHEKNYGNSTLQRRLECYPCDNCDFQTYSLLVLFKHFYNGNCESEDNQEKYINWIQCYKCSYRTKRRSNVLTHILQKHTDVRNVSSGCDLKSHTVAKVTELMTVFKCTFCAFKTQYNTQLNRHIIMQHVAPKRTEPFKCEHCPYDSKYENNLKRHILRKHSSLKDGEETRKFNCQYCLYATHTTSLLKRHVLAKHTDVEHVDSEYKQWFKCNQCSYKTKRHYDLRTHIVIKHAKVDEIKWFKCEQCPFKTKLDRYLKMHCTVNHSYSDGINWLKCGRCRYKTIQKEYLKAHILSKHPASLVV